MTTVQTMLARTAVMLLIAAGALPGAGCAPKGERLEPPEVLVAPYDTSKGDVLWAVVPLGNESGVSIVDTFMVSDALVNKVDEARGLACLPLNRTIAAMRSRNMSAVRSPAEARAIANLLGVDGLIVGSVTAYDPYNPPKLGLKLALFSRESDGGVMSVDPIRLQMAYTDASKTQRTRYEDKPIATLSEHLDGANHEVQMEAMRYAVGRSQPGSALGWRRVLASMDLYTEFSAQVAVGRLLEQERLRLAQPVTSAEPTRTP
jgi:hypothetical protein